MGQRKEATMTNSIMTRSTAHVNRFVPAVTDFEQGRRNYRDGKRISSCSTDEMTAGWLHQEGLCERMYWDCMIAEARQ